MKLRLVFLYVLSGILLIVIIVLAMNKTEKVEEEKAIEEEIIFESKDTIDLVRKNTGQIETINLNYYLLCVVGSEMPFKYEYEALKAQAIVARTYLFNKIKNQAEEQGDVCDDYAHCQAFHDIENLEEAWKKKGYTDSEIKTGENKIKKAIVETDGLVVTYNNVLIDALFHASSPQRTENASAIWSEKDVPYLRSVENVEDESYENRQTSKEISYATFKNTLIENGYINDLSLEEFKNIQISEYTESGRVKKISVGAYNIKAENLRTLFGLYSTNFTFNINEDSIKFNVLGYGHGVGMSQVGAHTLAMQGKKYDEIIHHYYTNVEIVNIN